MVSTTSALKAGSSYHIFIFKAQTTASLISVCYYDRIIVLVISLSAASLRVFAPENDMASVALTCNIGRRKISFPSYLSVSRLSSTGSEIKRYSASLKEIYNYIPCVFFYLKAAYIGAGKLIAVQSFIPFGFISVLGAVIAYKRPFAVVLNKTVTTAVRLVGVELSPVYVQLFKLVSYVIGIYSRSSGEYKT